MRGAAFFAVVGRGTFLLAVDTGNNFNDDTSDALQEYILLGDVHCSCHETFRWSRPPCLEGHSGTAQAHVIRCLTCKPSSLIRYSQLPHQSYSYCVGASLGPHPLCVFSLLAASLPKTSMDAVRASWQICRGCSPSENRVFDYAMCPQELGGSHSV